MNFGRYIIFRIFLLQLIMFASGANIMILHAQMITLERVSVFANAAESAAEGLGLAPLEISWLLDASVPGNYIVRIDKFEAGVDEIVFQEAVSNLAGNKWGDPDARPDLRPELYKIVLLDDDGEAIPGIPYSSKHGTIFMNPLLQNQIDRCRASIFLQWDNYQIVDSLTNLPRAVPFTHNRIMVLPPNGVEYTVAQLPFDETEYELIFSDGPGEYRIRIQAVEFEPGTENVLRWSNSNARYISFDRPALNDIRILAVDVVDGQSVLLAFEVMENVAGDAVEYEYQIFRSNDVDGPYEPLGKAGWDAAAGRYVYNDTDDPRPDEGQVFYQIRAHLEDCDENIAFESDIVSTLFLQGEILAFSPGVLVIGFFWFHYPGVTDFTLYRQLPGETGFNAVASDPSEVPEDDLSAMAEDLAGEIIYYVEASYGGETIRSNVISVLIEHELNIPTAFRPTSVMPENQFFRPILPGGYIPPDYQLTIYNRWGQEMFTVINPGTSWSGWDGRDQDGREVPQGVYGFRLEYQIGGGPRQEKMGTVMLIR